MAGSSLTVCCEAFSNTLARQLVCSWVGAVVNEEISVSNIFDKIRNESLLNRVLDSLKPEGKDHGNDLQSFLDACKSEFFLVDSQLFQPTELEGVKKPHLVFLTLFWLGREAFQMFGTKRPVLELWILHKIICPSCKSSISSKEHVATPFEHYHSECLRCSSCHSPVQVSKRHEVGRSVFCDACWFACRDGTIETICSLCNKNCSSEPLSPACTVSMDGVDMKICVSCCCSFCKAPIVSSYDEKDGKKECSECHCIKCKTPIHDNPFAVGFSSRGVVRVCLSCCCCQCKRPLGESFSQPEEDGLKFCTSCQPGTPILRRSRFSVGESGAEFSPRIMRAVTHAPPPCDSILRLRSSTGGSTNAPSLAALRKAWDQSFTSAHDKAGDKPQAVPCLTQPDTTSRDTSPAQATPRSLEDSLEEDSTPPTPDDREPIQLDPCNVFVKYLPSDLDDAALYTLFSAFGEIVSSKVMVDHRSGCSLGYGFVKFKTPEQAKVAINSMTGQKIQNKKLLCKLSNACTSTNNQEPTTNLYIKPLPPSLNYAEALHKCFESFGPISDCKVMIDRLTGESKNIGFVRFTNQEAATFALERMNGAKIEPDFPPLIVKYAETEEQRAIRKAQMKEKKLDRPRRPRNLPTAVPVIYPTGFPVNTLPYPEMCSYPAAAYPPFPNAVSYPPAFQPVIQIPGKEAFLERTQKQEGVNLFVFHLPSEMVDADLFRLFSPHGTIDSVKVIVNKQTGESKGYGFVRFLKTKDAMSAINALNGLRLGKKHLKVTLKKFKADQK